MKIILVTGSARFIEWYQQYCSDSSQVNGLQRSKVKEL
jgi:hypothetical protein